MAAPHTDLLREVNRKFVTGVTVVTTNIDGVPRGLAVNAYTSISLDPPLVMVAVNQSSSTHELLFASSHLAINFISVEQLDVVRVFASKATEKFETIEWEAGPFGSPHLQGASAVLEVEVRERIRASTHTIFIGRVVDATVSDAAPMVYASGGFFDGGRLEPLIE